jgi:hypothetical protein
MYRKLISATHRTVRPFHGGTHRRKGSVENRTDAKTCPVSFLCPSQLDTVRFHQLCQRLRKPSMRVF